MRVGQEDLRPDQDVVRPGTSAALTARAIDATPPPPLAQAQDAVAAAVAAVPRMVDSVSPPLLGASLGFTLLFAMAASQRFRLRMAPLLMSGILLLPVSNYHEAQEPAPVKPVATATEQDDPDVESEWREKTRRAQEAQWERWRDRNDDAWDSNHDSRDSHDSHDDDDSNDSDDSDDSDDNRDYRRSRRSPVPRIELIVPRGLVENWQPVVEMIIPDDWSRDDAERFLRRNARRLQREISRLREQHQLELRGRAYSMEYHHHHSRR